MNVTRAAVFLPLALLALMPCTSLNAQTQRDSISFRPEVERQFVEAMKYFTGGRFDSAAAVFVRNIHEFPKSHRTTGSYIMGAKAYFRLANYRESIKLLKDLMDLFPESNYVDDAHYTLGLDYYGLARYEDAASEFVKAFQKTSDPKLRSRSRSMLETITERHLSVAQLQLVFPDVTSDDIKALFNLRIAQKVYASGDVKAAQELLRSVSAMAPSIKYVGEAITLLQKYERGGVIKIGVVLPLMLKADKSSSRELGVELLDGIKLAVEEYNQETFPKINIEIRDSEREPSVAARQVTDLCADENIAAILGPVFSNEAFASVGIANARGIPIITPTANANGIAAVGAYVFQANPDYDVRGRAMARYAYQAMGARRFALLSPIESPSKQLADAFVDEVKNLGAELIDAEWYSAGSTDLRPQLEAMRRKALEKSEVSFVDFSRRIKHTDVNKMVLWGVRQEMLDSIMEREGTISVEALFGKNGQRIADSLAIPTQRTVVRYDSLELPVSNIDAMFVPIAGSDEIGVVGPQLRLVNFQTQILGTGEWQEPSELDQHRRYVDGVIFSTDVYWDQNNANYKLFVAKFQRAYAKKPTKNSMFGYDTMKMLAQVIQQGATHRNEIDASLVKVRDFPGIHAKVSFNDARVNAYLTLLQFKNRTVKKIGEIDLTSHPNQ